MSMSTSLCIRPEACLLLAQAQAGAQAASKAEATALWHDPAEHSPTFLHHPTACMGEACKAESPGLMHVWKHGPIMTCLLMMQAQAAAQNLTSQHLTACWIMKPPSLTTQC